MGYKFKGLAAELAKLTSTAREVDSFYLIGNPENPEEVTARVILFFVPQWNAFVLLQYLPSSIEDATPNDHLKNERILIIDVSGKAIYFEDTHKRPEISDALVIDASKYTLRNASSELKTRARECAGEIVKQLFARSTCLVHLPPLSGYFKLERG